MEQTEYPASDLHREFSARKLRRSPNDWQSRTGFKRSVSRLLKESTMISQLTKHEDSWAVVIDQPMIDLLKIEPETLLEVTTDGKVLTITPVSEPISQSEFEAALEKTNREFGAVLRRLAE